MAIDWKTLLTVVVTALMSAGGTVGAQSLVGVSAHPQVQSLHLVKNMTGLCIRIEEPLPAAAPRITTSSTTKGDK